MVDIQLLYKKYLMAGSVAIDSRNLLPGSLFFAIRGERFNGNAFAANALAKGASGVIIDDSNYLKPTPEYILVKDVLATLQALAGYHRLQYGPHFPIIAITGSYGKTTTKELIYQVLSTTYKTIATQGNLNTSIGVALTLLSIRPDTEMAVIEMGASQLGDIAGCCKMAQPTHGLITTIGEAHLDRFGNLEEVLKGKGELYDHLDATHGVLFLNTLDPMLGTIANKFSTPITYPQETDYYTLKLVDQNPHLVVQSRNDRTIHTHLLGEPHTYNVAASLCIAKYFNVPMELAYQAIEKYVPADKRMEFVCRGSNQYIIDSYNASPASVEAALDALLRLKVAYRVVVLSDMAALGKRTTFWHERIIKKLYTSNFDEVLLCGPLFTMASKGIGLTIKCFDSKEAIWDHLHHINYQHTGFLFKGSHSWAMHTLVNAINPLA